MTGTPFAPHEEQLQYMSFHAHERDGGLIHATGAWDDGNGALPDNNLSSSGADRSGGSSPGTAQKKKKITLDEYKNRKTATPVAEKERDKKAMKQTNGSGRDMMKDSIKPANRPPVTEGTVSAGQKRGIEKTDGEMAQKSETSSTVKEDKQKNGEPPAKKPRTSQSEQKPKINGGETMERDKTTIRLPPLLSPTLPSRIEEDLARHRKEKAARERLGHKKSSSAASNTSTASTEANKTLLHQRSLNTKLSDVVKSPLKAPSNVSEAEKRPRSSEGGKGPAKSVKVNGTKVEESSAAPRESLIVKLKYGRNKKKAVERITAFTTKPKKLADTDRSRDVSKDRGPLKQAEKRSRPVEDDKAQEPAPKRPRAPSTLPLSEKIRTPVAPPARSPGLPSIQVRKATLNTPKRDGRGASSVLPATPENRDVATPEAPSSVDNRPPRSTPKEVTDNARIWRVEQQKHLDLGRQLKHAADKLLQTKSGAVDVPPADDKHGAVLAMETVLCYFIGFTAADQSRHCEGKAPDPSNWRSLLGYLDYVEKRTKPYPDLHGLCLQLGGLCRDIIHPLDLDRLFNEPIPSNPPDVVPAEPQRSSFSDEPAFLAAKTTYDRAIRLSQRYTAFKELKTSLVDNKRRADKDWVQGVRQLSEERLKKMYPGVWSGRSTDQLVGKGERLTPGKYKGNYYLPLGKFSTGIEGVRIGMGILEEWARREGVEWKGRVLLL